MPLFSPIFFSIVFIGRQNPQILNHDFLIRNKVLPVEREPFRSLIKESSDKKPAFTEYLSTPVVTTLAYKWISIIVEENRFQIKDSNFKEPLKSPIVSITKKYFGEILRYTPFRFGGMNFAGKLSFLNEDDERDFDDRLGIDSKKFETNFKTKEVRYSSRISLPWSGGQIELRVEKPKEGLKDGNMNFNFEYIYEDIDKFIGKLDGAEKVYRKFNEILKNLKLKRK